jgi:hypothetical protein
VPRGTISRRVKAKPYDKRAGAAFDYLELAEAGGHVLRVSDVTVTAPGLDIYVIADFVFDVSPEGTGPKAIRNSSRRRGRRMRTLFLPLMAAPA